MEAAVAGYAEGVLKNSLGKLGSFLWSETLLIGSVRQDIQFIRDELMSMNAVMQDLIRAGHLNQQMNTWMLQVLEVACDAELCTDEFVEKVGARRDHGCAAVALHYVRSLPTLFARYRIAKTIQELKSRAKEVSERRSRYSATVIASDSRKSELTHGTSKRNRHLVRYNNLKPAAGLVGVHTESIKIATRFLFQRQVFVGPMGSGKTALARMLYHRFNSTLGIPASAWVTVSCEANMNWVLEDILGQVMKKPPQGIGNYNLTSLSDMLREELTNKWYFLVLDSLWSVQQWQIIKAALPAETKGTIVVTTRNEEVAQECCCDIPDVARHVHKMQPLPEEELYKLFDELLPNGVPKEAHKDLWKEIRDLLVKASPMPLALKCICGILAGVNIKLSQFMDLAGESISIVQSHTHDEEDRIKKVVKYCWSEHLPSSLERFCKDLSIFPEGYVISRKKLMQRWIAKGLIPSRRGFSSEEVAESYFDELISRCIIEPVSIRPSGKIRRCVINNVFKEVIAPLLICNASNPESVNPASSNQPVPDPPLLDKKKRPNPHSNKKYNDLQVPDSDPACFQLYNISPLSEFVAFNKDLFLKKREMLTFLDLEGCKGLSKDDLNKICDFVELRFLSLRNTDVEYLPKKIGNLKLLETLDIRETKIEKLPSGIVSLDRLKHLLAGYVDKPEMATGTDFVPCSRAVEFPTGISKMQALQTLAHVYVTRASEILLAVRELIKLRKLGLVISEKELNSRPLCITIMMLSASLRSLSVCDERDGGSLDFLEYLCFPPQKLETLHLKGNLMRVPQWVADHVSLTKITLSHTRIGNDDLELLGKIASLCCLKFYSDSFREDELVLSKGAFRALRVLVVHCDTIETIQFVEDSAPSLEVFEWVLPHNSTGNLLGVEKLPELRDVSFVAPAFDSHFSAHMTYAFEKHVNAESLDLKFIRKENL